MWLGMNAILPKHQLSVFRERPTWLDKEVNLVVQTAMSLKKNKKFSFKSEELSLL